MQCPKEHDEETNFTQNDQRADPDIKPTCSDMVRLIESDACVWAAYVMLSTSAAGGLNEESAPCFNLLSATVRENLWTWPDHETQASGFK